MDSEGAGTEVAMRESQEAARMARAVRALGAWIGASALVGCIGSGTTDGPASLGRTDYGAGTFALENSSRESGILRFGDSLRLRSSPETLSLHPYGNYHFTVDSVTHDGTHTALSEGDVAANGDGSIPPTTLAHDIGDMPGSDESQAEGFEVTLWDQDDLADKYESFIPLLRTPALQGGWNVQEVDPPHVYASQAGGTPTNAFAVSDDGSIDPGEVAGPIFVGGEGLPTFAAGQQVDVYVVRDRDLWQRTAIPQLGEPDHIAGPVQVTVNADGSLVPTQIWQPTVHDVGIYDLLVDVDQNGMFDWELGNKDGADGEAKVGITIQYSQAWVRARSLRHIIMNIAFNSDGREGEWKNVFSSGDELYLYVNPDVTTRPELNHKMVYKWVVAHQDFDAFWNNPASEDANGCIGFADYVMGRFQVPPQHGCTNSAPLHVGRGDNIMGSANGAGQFDVVFTFDGDGEGGDGEPRYCPGVDILDITSGDTFESLVTDIHSLPVEQRVGFTVQ
jgi:hypothetical protein